MEEEEDDPNILWGVLALEDEQANVGQVNLTLISQHALAQTEEGAPPRSTGEDTPLRLAKQVRPTPTGPNAPPRSAGEDVPLGLVEQVRPALTDPTGGSKRLVADVVE